MGSAALPGFQAGFGGIWYTARHDPRGGLHSVALFAKPGLQADAPRRLRRGMSEPIGDDLLDDAVARFGLEIIPAGAV